MEYSLDDYIRQNKIMPTNTSVKSRLGFQQGASALKRNAAITRPPITNRFGPTSIGTFDARQKLLSRPSTTVVSKTSDGFNVSSSVSDSNSSFTHTQPTRLQTIPDHGILQKTKYADARQRLEMKRRLQVGAGDARMHLLAKRRFRMTEEESAGGDNIHAIPSGNQKPHVTVVQSTKTDSIRPVRVTLSAQNQISRTEAPVALLPGASINRVFHTGIQANVQPAAFSRQMLMSGINSRRTFSAKNLQGTSVVEFDFDKGDDYVTPNSRCKISIVNDHYEDQRPIETIVSGRSVSGKTKAVAHAANTAAKTAVAAAAMAASRTGARPGAKPAMKTGVAQNKSVLKGAEPVVSQPPSTAARSPIQGYRVMVSNLHPSVSIDDLLELYSDVGPLKNVRMSRPTVADVVFVNIEDAVAAMRLYDSRELDGLPMSVKLMFQCPSQISPKRLEPTVTLDLPMLHRALFKTVVEGSRPSIPVNFTVQL